MLTTNEAPAEVNYEDASTASLAKLVDQRSADIAAASEEASREEKEEETSKQTDGGQVKEEAATSKEVESTEAAKPDEATVEAEEATKDEFEWAPDELKESLKKGTESGALNQDTVEVIKSNYMKARGFERGMEANASTRKDNEALIADGESFRQLMENDQMRSDWVAFLSDRSKQAEETIPEFDTEAEFVTYNREQAEKVAAKTVEDALERRFTQPQQKADALVGLAEEHMESLEGVSPEMFNSALVRLNDEIRGGDELPWDVLTTSEVFGRRIKPHLEMLRLTAELESLKVATAVSKNEQAKSSAAGSASATSPPGRSTVTPTKYPDTPAGRAQKTLDELGATAILD